MTYSKIEKNNAINCNIKINDIKVRSLLREKLVDEQANAIIIAEIYDILAGKPAALYRAVENYIKNPELCSDDDKRLFACAKIAVSAIPLSSIPVARKMMNEEKNMYSKPVYPQKADNNFKESIIDDVKLPMTTVNNNKKMVRSLTPNEIIK